MPQPQQVYDVLKRRFVKLEVEAEAHNIDQQTDSPELTGGSEAARQGLEADGQTLEEEVAEARLVLLGRNGVGKTTQLERWMLVGEVSLTAVHTVRQRHH